MERLSIVGHKKEKGKEDCREHYAGGYQCHIAGKLIPPAGEDCCQKNWEPGDCRASKSGAGPFVVGPRKKKQEKVGKSQSDNDMLQPQMLL